MALSRWRVQMSVAGLRYGEIVEIDPRHAHWKRLIERGVLVRVPNPER